MHEMAYVRNVVDIVNQHAAEANATEVKAIYLTIGMARDIVEDYFEGLFQFLARGTVAEHAEIVIRRVPLTVSCNRCKTVFPLNVHDEKTWVCPACGAERDYTLNSGMEFLISRIDVVSDDRRTPAGAATGATGAIEDAGAEAASR